MKIIIYGIPNCSACESAKSFCKKKDIDYEYKQIGFDIQLDELQQLAGSSVRTAPQIFQAGGGFFEYIGGFNDLKSKFGVYK